MHSVENNCNNDGSRLSEGVSSIYMCKLCNLFSPNHGDLLLHVTENHSKEGLSPDHIIIPLRPLAPAGRASEDLCVVKRKRGRPKGSTKKSVAEEEPAESNGHCVPDGPAEAEDGRLSPEPGQENLECRKCGRTFSNVRQLKKHICIIVLNDDEDVTQGNEFEGKFILPDYEKEKEKPLKRSRLQKTEKTQPSRDAEKSQGVNPIIRVLLTAHEAIPGATKIVPVEAAAPSAESEATSQPPELEQSLRRGYQEYAIQQGPQEQAPNSGRVASTQLKIFTCEYCNKVFKFKHSLQTHLRIHTNEKPYKCPLCNYASAIKANLSVHMRKHTGEKFSCDHCAFSCLSKGHLKVHIERVHKKIKQHCSFCKKKYSDVKNLIKHVQDSHNLLDKKVKESFDELRLLTREGKRQLLYDCHICERKFKNELERDRHMLVHGDERPFACELCDHGTTKYQSLELHIRKHPFVYACSNCCRKFVSTVRLKAHLGEFHPDLEQETLLNDSISQSFCLLEPGSDIQQEALGDLALHTQEDVGAMPPTDIQDGMPDHCRGFKSPDLTLVSKKFVSHGALPDCTTAKLSDSPDVASEVSPEDLLQRLTERDANHLYANLEVDDVSGSVSRAAAESSHLPDGEMDGLAGKVSFDIKESADNEAHPPLFSLNHLPASLGDAGAFMAILNGMKKRQLSMELLQKIRKVYGELECEYCGKLFWYQVHYDMHVRTHTREHLYFCSQCTYSSITKNCLKRHVIQKHSNMSLQCPAPGCSYSSPDKYKLQAHLRIHTALDKKTYSCPACEKSFSDDRLIKSHIRANHPDVSVSLISEVLGRRVQMKGLIGKRGAKCPYCDAYFMKNGSDLQRHIWAHEGVKPFKCTMCDYATGSKSNLKAHMNRHSTEKTHLCDMCGKKFKSKGTLKSHKLLHTVDGKQFKCTICEFTALQKPQLVRHMEQHTSVKPFGCALCHYSCTIPSSLKRHYNKKHPNEECVNSATGELSTESFVLQGGIKCPVCSLVYGTKCEFSRHLKSKHGLKLLENDKEAGWEPVDVTEEISAQFLHITEAEADVQGTQTAVAALQDLRYTSETSEKLDPTAVNILQQIIELGAESHDAVASVVAMAPGTVTVVEQVTEEERSANHTVMIQEALQQASVGLAEQHHLVVSSDEVEGIETVTVYTQGEEASEFIVYVQEAMQPVTDGTMEHILQEI